MEVGESKELVFAIKGLVSVDEIESRVRYVFARVFYFTNSTWMPKKQNSI